jgi:hypothetical protein
MDGFNYIGLGSMNGWVLRRSAKRCSGWMDGLGWLCGWFFGVCRVGLFEIA